MQYEIRKDGEVVAVGKTVTLALGKLIEFEGYKVVGVVKLEGGAEQEEEV